MAAPTGEFGLIQRVTARLRTAPTTLLGPGDDAALVSAADGVTWEVTTAGPAPAHGVVVSAVSRADGTRYRVVSAERPAPDAVPVAPTLEEGYVALMRRLSPAATP